MRDRFLVGCDDALVEGILPGSLPDSAQMTPANQRIFSSDRLSLPELVPELVPELLPIASRDCSGPTSSTCWRRE